MIAALASSIGCSAVDPFTQRVEAVLPVRGAVASEHPLATKAGLRVLEAGGNAADAAVATALALAVVYPQAGNLGGGGFALWCGGPKASDARRGPFSIDFRETAPSRYTAELYLDEDGEVVPERSLTTPLAVGVPGSPLGLYELYSQLGSRTLSFATVCESAIQLAEDGFNVDPWLAQQLRRDSIRKLLTADPGSAALFYPAGEPLQAGARLVQPALARTLRSYAATGPRAIYTGAVAKAIVDDLREADLRAGRVAGSSLMTVGDLESYTARRREPLVGSFRGHEIIGMPPPSSGGVALLQVFGMLEGLPLEVARSDALRRIELGLAEAPTAMPIGDAAGGASGPPASSLPGLDARAIHWWIEAMRRAFADRAVHLGDPDHVDVPVEALLDPAWISVRRVSIGERADVDVAAWQQGPADESTETTHLSVVDRDGNAVSLTTTLNGSFGSGIYVEDAGFLLNNELDDFSILAGTPNSYGLVGSSANQLAPFRRPLSSMCPVIIRDDRGNVSLVLGSPGGPRIITAVTQVALRVLAYEQGLVDAIRAPRIHQQWRPIETRLERGWDPSIVEGLENIHDQPLIPADRRVFGSVQAIRVHPDGEVEAYSDPRRGGAAGIEGSDPVLPASPRAD